jgi:hypothetical protein
MIIDDFCYLAPLTSNGSRWELFTDQVMGGVSRGTMSREAVLGRAAMRMQGIVSLQNNGGFVQVGLDLAPGGCAIDASHFVGIEIDVTGNGENYNCHLRTLQTVRPWQSYRQSFQAGKGWTRVRLPFESFSAHRIDAPLDLQRLRRIGLVAIGRAFQADLSVSRLVFYGP